MMALLLLGTLVTIGFLVLVVVALWLLLNASGLTARAVHVREIATPRRRRAEALWQKR